MWALIALVVTRPKGTFLEHAPVDIDGGESWVLIGGFMIPAIILCRRFRGRAEGDDELSSARWHANASRDPHYGHDLMSAVVIHSFWAPSVHGKVDLIPGMTNRIRIEADRPGTFRGQCAEYCGEQHAHMILLVIADPPEKFQQWLAAQRETAAAPETDQKKLGEQLFESHVPACCAHHPKYACERPCRPRSHAHRIASDDCHQHAPEQSSESRSLGDPCAFAQARRGDAECNPIRWARTAGLRGLSSTPALSSSED
jgi:hypothetical protein